MQDAERGDAPELNGQDLRIGVVQARFNRALTDALAQACLDELKRLGVATRHITHVTVPGALEVPVALMAAMLLIKHAGNLRRLLAGQESKIGSKKKA